MADLSLNGKQKDDHTFASTDPARARNFDPLRRSCVVGLAGLFCLGGASALAQTGPSEFDPAKYRGKVVYVDFWASWCGPCQLSFPYMDELNRRMPGADFALVAINVDHSREKADQFLKRFGGSVPVIFDTSGAIASKFGVKDMPTSILIGRDGRTRYVHKGFFPKETPNYDAHIAELIHEK